MNNTTPYSFEMLFKRAIKEWPVEVDLKIISPGLIDTPLYSVEGLGRLADDLGGRHIGSQEEVLMRNLHDAICSVLHQIALFSTRVRIQDLRQEAVKSKLGISLKEALSNQDLGWDEQDLKLISDYLRLEGENP